MREAHNSKFKIQKSQNTINQYFIYVSFVFLTKLFE